MCRLRISTIAEYRVYKQKWIAQYAITEVPDEMVGQFVKVACKVCRASGVEKSFVAQKHPKGYFCPECGGINCDEEGAYEGADAKQLVRQQNDLLLKKNGFLIYPLIL